MLVSAMTGFLGGVFASRVHSPGGLTDHKLLMGAEGGSSSCEPCHSEGSIRDSQAARLPGRVFKPSDGGDRSACMTGKLQSAVDPVVCARVTNALLHTLPKGGISTAWRSSGVTGRWFCWQGERRPKARQRSGH